MLKAKKLQPGATIGVVSPASPSDCPSELPRAKFFWEAMGFHVVFGEHVDLRKGFVAASETERAADINAMFANPAIDAVCCTRGGYGSAQIIRHLDFDAIRENPKIFTGFSDITSLHLAMNKFAGLVTFHGPGFSRFNPEDLTEYTKAQFFKALTSDEPLGDIPLADEKKWLHTITEGVAEGELIGGNLTLLCASMGTPYQPDTVGKILFIEDVDTEPWCIDHSMSHLRNAGVLDGVAGVVIGECENCVPFDYKPGYLSDVHVEEVFEYYLKELGVPVLYGLPLGHTSDMATLPLGVKVRLDSRSKRFEVLESGVL